MIHPRVTMNLNPILNIISKWLNMISTYGMIKRVVCLHQHELEKKSKVKETYY